MIFANLRGDQAGFMAWAEKAIQASSFSEFVYWPIAHGAYQDLRALHQEAPYLWIVFKTMSWLAAPFSTSATHAMNTLMAAYFLHLALSLAAVWLFARLYVGRGTAAIVAATTCISLAWWARVSGHFNLTAFYLPFLMAYLFLGAPRWTLKRRLITGAVVGLAGSACYYYLYLSTVVLAFTWLSFFLLWIALRKRPGFPSPLPYLSKTLPAAGIALVFFVAANMNLVGAGARFGADTSVSDRTFYEINLYSNKAADFFRIHPDSPEHRVLGLPETQARHGSNPTEQSVFLGLGGSIFFFLALGLGIAAIARGKNLETILPLALLLFWSWHISLATVAHRIREIMPMIRAYGRIAILVLPTAVILAQVSLRSLTGNTRALRALQIATALLLIWPIYYGQLILGSLTSFNDEQARAVAFVDQHRNGPIQCLEFAQDESCRFAFTDGFKIFLAARKRAGIHGVSLAGGRVFNDETRQPMPYAKDECLKIPREIYDVSYPGVPGC